MADPEIAFRNEPDNSYAGRFFAIATGNYMAPAAQQELDAIIEQLPITPEQREAVYEVYVRHLKNLHLMRLRLARPSNPLNNSNNSTNYRMELTDILGAEAAAQELANPALLGTAAMGRRKHLLKMRNNATRGGRRRSSKRRRSRKN